jgi:hypothetical protein
VINYTLSQPLSFTTTATPGSARPDYEPTLNQRPPQ